MALKRTEEYTFKMTDAIHRALVQQQRSLKTACCALVSLALHSSTVMLARAIQMAKDSAVAGRPAIYERICAWERTLTIFRGAIAVTTWDEPQVLLQQMEGCRLPISNIVSSTVGGGNNEGSYEALTEVYDKTPDGYLAFCPYPPGGEVDVLFISDSSLALVPDPSHGKASCFSAGDLIEPWGEVRKVFTKMLWGKGLRQIVDYLPEAIDDIEANSRTNSWDARAARVGCDRVGRE